MVRSTSGKPIYGGASTKSIPDRLAVHKASGTFKKSYTVECHDMRNARAHTIGETEKNMNDRLHPALNKYRGGNGIH